VGKAERSAAQHIQDALSHFQAGRLEEAELSCRRALDLVPGLVDALVIQGHALAGLGRLDEGLSCGEQASRLAPEQARTRSLYAMLLHRSGDLPAALGEYEAALAADPKLQDALINSGAALQALGQLDAAVQRYRQTIASHPGAVLAHANLGAALTELEDFGGALSALEQAARLAPTDPGVLGSLARGLKNCGRVAEAREAWKQVLALDPRSAPALFGAHLTLPPLHATEADVQAARKAFAEGLDRVEGQLDLTTAERVLEAVQTVTSTTNFYLHYQGCNDLALQRRWGALLTRILHTAFPQFTQPIARASRSTGERLRVGFISSYFRLHSIYKTHGHFIARLDREQFEIHTIHLGAKCDEITQFLADASDHFHHWPDVQYQHLQVVRDLHLDALVYPDLGMEPRLQLFAPLRLAPVQCNMGGHPITSGLPTMDWFLSSDLMEAEDADAHYSEQFHRLPGLLSSYPRPPVADASTPASVGERRDGEVRYVCLQSLYKLLPQFDCIYARIAARVPGARFWFIQESSAAVTAALEQRLALAFSGEGLDAARYCQFHPRLSQQEFFGLASSADVVLDSVLWSGNNSSMEASACGRPIVTLPGPMMRGRHSYAICRQMGIDETTASDLDQYIEIAVRLGTDRSFYAERIEAVRQHRERLFDDPLPIRAFEDFLLDKA